VIFKVTVQIDHKECSANDNVEAVESGCNKKNRAVNTICDCEWGVFVFLKLDTSKKDSEEDCSAESLKTVFPSSLKESVVGPCNSGS